MDSNDNLASASELQQSEYIKGALVFCCFVLWVLRPSDIHFTQNVVERMFGFSVP